MSDEIDRLLASLTPEAREALRSRLDGPAPLDSDTSSTRVNGLELEPDEPTQETWLGDEPSATFDPIVDGSSDDASATFDTGTPVAPPRRTMQTAAPSATFDSGDDTSDDSLGGSQRSTMRDRGPTPSGVVPDLQPAPRDEPEPTPEPPRYTELQLLGEGGMGTVLRVKDRELNRTVAMKVLRPKMVKSPRALTRFREEAQIAAQLQHPGIIPVHDIGLRPDGSVYFTMKEVKGKTFEDVIDDVHLALEEGRTRTEDGWSFRRLIDTFHRVCETVAYAHHRGVVHRDLKPENIMVADFGEVLVLDWGLAKVLAEENAESEEAVQTDRSLSDESMRTRMGAIAGTPSYMAPEQARGQIHKIGPTSDVYGLGGILYAILSGRTPYTASTVRDMLDMVSEGEPITPPHKLRRTPGPVPVELSEIAMKALSHKQKDRYEEAGALATEVAIWLDGARKREKALEIVAEARRAADDIPRLKARAEALAAEAEAEMAALDPSAGDEARWPTWDKELAAERSRDQAARTELEMVQGLRSALSHAPDLPEAHDALADHFHAAHQAAESAGDGATAQRLELELRAHNRAGRYDRYLTGDGAVTLITDPPGARVRLHRYEEHHKRMVPVFVEDLGETPIIERPLARGTWMLEVHKDGHHPVTYPVHIDRLQHWDGVPPDEAEPHPIPLPRLGELADDDCYVPAGWYWSGGDNPTISSNLPWRRLWCHGMVFKRYQVTVAQMLDAANAMVREGREADALRMVPRENAVNDEGALIFGRTPDGGFELVPDKDGDLWDPGWPVFLVNQAGARLYLDHLRAQDGRPWRLPHELEWEKGARGVAAWPYPWGQRAESSFACVLAPKPHPAVDFPIDLSAYGLRGCSGGMAEWTRDPSPIGTPVVGQRVRAVADGDHRHHIVCGGAWGWNIGQARLDNRKRAHPTLREPWLSFRAVRPWGPDDPDS